MSSHELTLASSPRAAARPQLKRDVGRTGTIVVDKLFSMNAPHLRFLSEEEAEVHLEHGRRAQSVMTAVIRGWKCDRPAAFHSEIGAALQFPGYYGENWDALDECLRDLSWLASGDYLLVVNRIEAVFPSDDQSLRLLLEILSDASGVWKRRGVHFDVILCGDQTGLERAVALAPGQPRQVIG